MLTNRAIVFILRDGWKCPEVVEIPLSSDNQIDLMRRFRREVYRQDQDGRRGETWPDLLIPLFRTMSQHLNNVKRIVFVPIGIGHLLPWAVIAKHAGIDLPWITIPALSSLIVLKQRTSIDLGSALVIGNPKGDLTYAEDEARVVAKHLNVQPLIGSQATKKEVMKHLPGAYVAHFATHAYFAPGSPLDSGIILADGILTAREIMALRIHPNLITLSACETGITESIGGDEMAGLTQAFLQAGAKSLLVSLWNVNDHSTSTLMDVFYDTWRSTTSDKAEALQRAISETQEHWPATYYWGPFIFIGDWQ